MAEADLKKNASEITKEIAKQIKEHLNPNGILVLGEYESSQVSNPEIVPKALTEMGFKPLNKTNQHIANVWKLA